MIHKSGLSRLYPRPRISPIIAEQVLNRWWTTNCSLRELAAEFGVSHTTVHRLVQARA
ncbi:Uncharacterised protein [uncultured archaeon]|nr:Uncharacterised protein [uncultured archaeon]